MRVHPNKRQFKVRPFCQLEKKKAKFAGGFGPGPGPVFPSGALAEKKNDNRF